MKPPRLLTALLAALLLAPLSACSGQGGGDRAVSAPDARSGFASEVSDGTAGGTAGGAAGDAAKPQANAERSIIRNGEISVRVGDPAASAEKVARIATQLGGYVESQSVQERDGDAEAGAQLQLRIPADRLDEALMKVGAVGEVAGQSVTASDVTAEHVDLQARVKALQTSVDRLTKLMAGAATTSELLEAEAALSARQQELDGLNAQLKALEGQISEASLSVNLIAKSALPGGPANFWDGLVAGWQSLGTTGAGALVLLGVLLPWLVVLGVIALLIAWIVRSRLRKRRAGAMESSGPSTSSGTGTAGTGPSTGTDTGTADQDQSRS